MAITSEEANRLARLLPDDMHCDNARERLLCTAYVLQALTDAEHTLSNADLRQILTARFGPGGTVSENTLAADLRAIQQSGCLDIELHVTPSGYWCERTQLTPAKVRMLLNAVQASRFLTFEQSSELQEDLFSLVSRHQEDDLASQVHVDQRVRKSYQQVFDIVDTVARAIRLGKKVEFCYTYSDFAGRPHPLDGDNGSPLRVETPIALYFSESNYYMETYTNTPWRHGLEVTLSRVDRMFDVRVSDEDANRTRAVYDLRRSAQRRMADSFDMVGGPMRLVFVRVRSDATNLLFDRFGFGLRFGQTEGARDDASATAITLLKVPQTFTFYRWLSSAGNSIVVVEPPPELALRSGPWAKALADIERDRLVEDHAMLVRGFLEYLDRARAPYL